jgi:hypothetical protein
MPDTSPFLPPHLEGQSSWLSKTTSARVLGHPLVWSAITGLFIIAGYLWLQNYAQPLALKIERSYTDNELIGAQPKANWNPEIYQPTETQDLMLITQQADESRANQYRDLIDLEDQVQPLLRLAREQLDDLRLTGSGENNAWSNYQAILALDADNKVAQSGLAQILQTIEENARYAVDENRYEEAEGWLTQLDGIRENDSFQADLRKRIAEQIQNEMAEAEASKRNAQRLRLLQNALSDARAAMRASPPNLRAAYDLFQRALELDEANLRASAGLEQIHKERSDLAKLAIAKGDYASAQQQISRLKKIGADNRTIDRLNAAIRSARARAAAQNSLPRDSGPPTNTQRLRNAVPNSAVINNNAPNSTATSDKYSQLLEGIRAYYAGDYNLSFEKLHPLAEEDVARAQFRLGIMYNQGRTVVKNKDLARQWIARALPTILRAAQNNEAWAQADLGTAYELGVGVNKNMRHAASWYQKAADQGYAGAQTNLGVLYGSGYGVQYDRQRAVYWLKLAAAQGDKIAQDNLKILNAR